jgi:hypothetical protein
MKKILHSSLLILSAVLIWGCGEVPAPMKPVIVEKFQCGVFPSPDFVISSMIKDSTVTAQAPTAYAGNDDYLKIGYEDGHQNCALLYFNIVSTIPRDAEIIHACLKMRSASLTDDGPFTPLVIEAHPATAYWDHYYITWDDVSPLMDLSLSAGSISIDNTGDSSFDRILEIELDSALVESWLEPAGNNGLILSGGIPAETNNVILIPGCEFATYPSYRPMLIVWYSLP